MKITKENIETGEAVGLDLPVRDMYSFELLSKQAIGICRGMSAAKIRARLKYGHPVRTLRNIYRLRKEKIEIVA